MRFCKCKICSSGFSLFSHNKVSPNLTNPFSFIEVLLTSALTGVVIGTGSPAERISPRLNTVTSVLMKKNRIKTISKAPEGSCNCRVLRFPKVHGSAIRQA
jgi:hypothetical protein